MVILLQEFNFLQPENYREALNLLNEYHGKSKIIAGGTDLIVDLRKEKYTDLKYLIDISKLDELEYIKEDGEYIKIGSYTNHKSITKSDLVNKYAKILTLGCSEIGSPQIRNRGTIGGNIITGSPCADSVTPLVALNAIIVIESKEQKREVPIEEFYEGPYRPKIKANELLKEVYFKKLDNSYQGDFIKVKRRNAVSKARINIAALGKIDQAGKVFDIRLAPGSITPKPQRFKSVEELVKGREPDNEIIEKMGQKVAEIMIDKSGYRWSTEYKRPVIRDLTKRILKTVLEVE